MVTELLILKSGVGIYDLQLKLVQANSEKASKVSFILPGLLRINHQKLVLCLRVYQIAT